MKLCSWAPGCVQETSSDAELCGYHEKLSGGLLGHSGEAEKAIERRHIRRRRDPSGRRDAQPDG